MSDKKELNALTALKGLFCLVIAIHNTLLIQFMFADIPGSSFILSFGGTLGNSIFLMISGFLFAYNYKNRIQIHQMPFSKFIARRFARLYPLYLLTNTVSFVINILLYGPSAINLEKIASTLLLMGAVYNNPTWFLSVLFACYLLFYFIAYHFKNNTQYFCAIAFIALLGASLQVDLPFLSENHCFAYLNFFTGCILAEVYPLFLKKSRVWLPHVCLAILGAIFYLLMGYGVEIIAGDVPKAFSLIITPMILYIALSDSIYVKVLQIKPLVYLGKISTSVYFWHHPLYFLFREFLIGEPITEAQYIIYIGLLLILSTMSFRYIENRKKAVITV